MSPHGTYARYSRKPGCRCQSCRNAKAAYMRIRRSAGTSGSFTHGTRNGYEENRCRCTKCSEAHSRADRRVVKWL